MDWPCWAGRSALRIMRSFARRLPHLIVRGHGKFGKPLHGKRGRTKVSKPLP